MNEIINLLKNNCKTSDYFDINNTNYLYHGIFIPYFKDSSAIISIIENGILTSKDQYLNGIISLEKLKSRIYMQFNGLFEQLKYRFGGEKGVLSLEGANIIFFSPNRNFFNRVFDISFVIKKDLSFIYLYSDECIKKESVSPTEFLAIKIYFDELLTPECVKERGVSIDEAIPRVIDMVNNIYDKLEETNLNIPIINSADGSVLNKDMFRQLRNYSSSMRKSRKHL